MQLNTTLRRSRICVAVISGITACAAAWAEPDVLERPAQIQATARSTTSALLAVGQAGPRLVTVGERGLSLWSDDQGKSWQQAQVPVSVTLTSVSFTTATTGWAVGHSGTILRTDDAGRTWMKMLDGKQVAALISEAAKEPGADPQFIANAERLVKDGPDKPFLDVRFIDENHGLVVGAYGLILETSDGGKQWRSKQQHVDNPQGLHLYGILYTESAIWLAGEQGSLFVSRNGGESYQPVATPYEGTYFGIVATGKNLVVYGMRGNAYWSDDQGATWEKCEIPGNTNLTAAASAGDGSLLLTDDGGNVYASKNNGKLFVRAAHLKLGPLSGLLEVADGQFLFVGTRGVHRAAPFKPATENKL
ncbi:MAG TPA: YCF48-related protein [Candidimonas sp.]|nr:YCF48-related protein [Candidimonas sp.]